ncbi:hypothetical protein [Hirschia baltica]|uniref:Uncharacterized protein n=1 Tax=Hirschia baltica (strain ATCC 49814 / DSM 5838 / IFAM 1418) TaxID=582402 RepID=C6XPZ9_HIRBI|nr:hypothetical protein [Hirschia baltica]ACT58516.1 hypothetical protein Hbal_0822 [Hirschia baltica ATCC 49814]
MKFLIALAFLVSGLLGTSSACAHAMGVKSASAHSTTIDEHTSHIHAAPPDQHDGHNTAPTAQHDMHGKSHGSCPEDCDGGPDCAGCSAIPVSVTVGDFALYIPLISAHFSLSDEAGFEKTYALEPPPPRTI